MEESLAGLWRMIAGFFRILSILLRVREIVEHITDFFIMMEDFLKWLWRKLFRRSKTVDKENPGVNP